MIFYKPDMVSKSQRLLDQIGEYSDRPLKVGQTVEVKNVHLAGWGKDKTEGSTVCVVKELRPETIVLFNGTDIQDFRTQDIELPYSMVEKCVTHIGANPFSAQPWSARLRKFSLPLGSMLERLFAKDSMENVEPVNWDPSVVDPSGLTQYYQRQGSWVLEDCRNLIESVYLGLGCGSIVVRRRGDDYLSRRIYEMESAGTDFSDPRNLAHVHRYDIVDGKSRLRAVLSFINGGFTDWHGNRWTDLSYSSRVRFLASKVFDYVELNEQTTDDEVIDAYLGVNHSGHPIDKEQLDFVRGIRRKFKYQKDNETRLDYMRRQLIEQNDGSVDGISGFLEVLETFSVLPAQKIDIALEHKGEGVLSMRLGMNLPYGVAFSYTETTEGLTAVSPTLEMAVDGEPVTFAMTVDGEPVFSEPLSSVESLVKVKNMLYFRRKEAYANANPNANS